jgi:hypothetical protein
MSSHLVLGLLVSVSARAVGLGWWFAYEAFQVSGMGRQHLVQLEQFIGRDARPGPGRSLVKL